MLYMPLSDLAPVQRPTYQLTYKLVEGHPLDLHGFSPPDSHIASPRAAMIFFFGGGWRHGSPDQFFPQCAELAQRGVHCFSADYRVASRHGTTPRESVEDAKSAIRWLRKYAHYLNIDPDRIAAGGGSAGAHIAAAAGSIPGIEAEGENPAISSRPDALVLFNPVLDQSPGGFGHEEVADYWRDISPRHHLGPHSPATLILSGTEDHLVPVSMLQACAQTLRESGVRCELDLYEGGTHGFFNPDRNGPYPETLMSMIRFLEEQGWFPHPA